MIGNSEQHERLGQDRISQDFADMDMDPQRYGRDTECLPPLSDHDYYVFYQDYVLTMRL
jgi:hypothetical protein